MLRFRKIYGHGELNPLQKIVTYVLLLAGAVLFVFPVYWMIITSLKHLPDVYTMPPSLLFFDIRWENYKDIFTIAPMGKYLWNTVWYSAVSISIHVAASSLVAFGFARVRAKGSGILFAIVLSTMMLPPQVTMIPQYLVFNKLGLIDTYYPLIIPAIGGGAFLIFLMRQFFLGLSKDLDEAVKIDGGGYWTVYFRIILPLSMPALATAAILDFMYRWNDLIGPLIYINSPEKFPLSLGLAGFTAAFGGTPWNLLMAASVVAVAPPLVLFFFTQKYFIRGIVISGTKG